MTDREKVIRGLECCTKKLCIYKDTENECPYSELCGDYEEAFEDCTTELAKDALALLKSQEPVEERLNQCDSCTKEYAECEANKSDLVFGCGIGNDNIIGCLRYVNRWKAQEPRVMTLKEASNSTVPMWFEKSGDECGWITGIDCSPIQATTIGQVDGDDWYNLPITDYGRLWRCWTSRPTDEQREAIPWMT